MGCEGAHKWTWQKKVRRAAVDKLLPAALCLQTVKFTQNGSSYREKIANSVSPYFSALPFRLNVIETWRPVVIDADQWWHWWFSHGLWCRVWPQVGTEWTRTKQTEKLYHGHTTATHQNDLRYLGICSLAGRSVFSLDIFPFFFSFSNRSLQRPHSLVTGGHWWILDVKRMTAYHRLQLCFVDVLFQISTDHSKNPLPDL